MLHTVVVRLARLRHNLIERAHWLAHCTYLSAGAIEGHGLHRWAALTLLVLVICAAVGHVEVSE